MKLSAKIFFDLERRLIDAGLDSDRTTFSEIKKTLQSPRNIGMDDFAHEVIYVILASGFSQKTAKKIYHDVINFLGTRNQEPATSDMLFPIFKNQNKIKAIADVWNNRQKYRDEYYTLTNSESRILYLESLPHIGKITAHHLARNLGEDIVKYDIWIQRLAVAWSGKDVADKINNQKLSPEIKIICDEMFDCLVAETGLPRGYIDVVLWKGAQNKMIEGL